MPRQIEIRFYAELNDFLPGDRRQRAFVHSFNGNPSVKDTIESIGVPHTEVDVILVDGRSTGFDRRLQGGERVAVYPVFERYDVSPVTRLRPSPLRQGPGLSAGRGQQGGRGEAATRAMTSFSLRA